MVEVKGQIISKCLFGVFNYFQKKHEKTSHSSKNELICSFLEEYTAWQFAFEINWLLVHSNKRRYESVMCNELQALFTSEWIYTAKYFIKQRTKRGSELNISITGLCTLGDSGDF